MITNKSPYWLTLCADLEQEDPLFVRSHISAEFLEATCEFLPASSIGGSVGTDPFFLTPAEQSAQHIKPTLQGLWAGRIATTGLQPWGTPIASPDACPTCGHRPWWVEQDQDYDDDDFDECIDPQTGFMEGYKRHG